MIKPNKCKNCQWYGKPYWSIINPCDNCPNENDYKTTIIIDGESLFKEILTEEEIKPPISAYGSIDVDKLNKTIERLNKIPDYNTLMKENNKLNNIIKNIDKMFEYYFLGNLKYDQDTVNTIYIKYVKLKELKEGK